MMGNEARNETNFVLVVKVDMLSAVTQTTVYSLLVARYYGTSLDFARAVPAVVFRSTVHKQTGRQVHG